MYKILPLPKELKKYDKRINRFRKVIVNLKNLGELAKPQADAIRWITCQKMRNFEGLDIEFANYNSESFCEEGAVLFLNLLPRLSHKVEDNFYNDLFLKQGYVIEINNGKADIHFESQAGFIHALSSLKQIICLENKGFYTIPDLYILDYPEIEVRSLSTTFAWYAGYGRVGFDMQLWGFDEWKEFIDLCSDFKINQLNMCMYGYWPFEFEEYPETVFRDFRMKVWNKESKNWIEISYTHPNIYEDFLPGLIKYAHDLSINIYAYVGLNSYNGGYSNVYRDRRMKLPEHSKFINDFDTLCLSRKENIEYLKKSMKRITEIGFDGIIFEESEEAFWFCNCNDCKSKYLSVAPTPAEAKHLANYELLKILYKSIKEKNPDCRVGLRAWREPPLEKDIGYLEKCKASIPEDIDIYWTPGLYVGEEEFEKWVEVFGRDRICARDTESNGVSATMGRLLRLFKSNVLRPDEETNQQYLENDIIQHKGSAKLRCKGINGYLFEFYEYFLTFFAHANYGWDSRLKAEEFYKYALDSVFGEKISDDVLYVLKNILTIHESQISIFKSSVFPFLRNKVSERDTNRIEKAISDWEVISSKITKIKKYLEGNRNLHVYSKHFDKLENTNNRNLYIYNLCLSSIKYDSADTWEEKLKYLKEIDYYNEMDFKLIKEMYFDVNPVDASGVKACMYPYHEIKRVINNILNPDRRDDNQIYLGVEALGWLWL
ncbi:MAG: hypothetical protein H5T85_01360 [Actinobacteria bacterium]|nr:hypothetical protein [Actinomycetota bacterium]